MPDANAETRDELPDTADLLALRDAAILERMNGPCESGLPYSPTRADTRARRRERFAAGHARRQQEAELRRLGIHLRPKKEWSGHPLLTAARLRSLAE